LKIKELINFGIPEDIIKKFEDNGYVELFPPQELAIKRGILEFKNLLIATPTASGKTFIGILAAIKNILKGKKVLYVCPLRAIASEKYEELNELLKDKIKIALSIGDYDSADPWLENYDFIISTYEKADSLLRHKAKWIEEISLVIIDEIHMIDSDRGATLEFLIARLRKEIPYAQYLALSATVKNAKEIANWLNAEALTINWRPVPLKEGIYRSGIILYSNNETKKINTISGISYIDLSLDCLKEDGQVLIFNNSRISAIRCAVKLQEYVSKELSREEKEKLNEISKMFEENDRNTQILKEMIKNGVAFHHAGLSFSSRKIVEKFFREGLIKVISSTPTLAAGVNVPARRVIIQDVVRYDPIEVKVEKLSVNEYKQLAGRAGRPRYDLYGEAIIIAKGRYDVDILMEEYIRADVEPVNSVINDEKDLRPHILSLIANDITNNFTDLRKILNLTFAARKQNIDRLLSLSRNVIDFLIKEGFVYGNLERFRASYLGKRINELYIDPLTASIIIKGIKELSVTNNDYDEIFYFYLICSSEDMQKLNVSKNEEDFFAEDLEKYLENKFLYPKPDLYDFETLRAYKTAKLLYEWINEEKEDIIADRFNIGVGDLYLIVQNAKWLLYSAKELAKLLGYKEISKELSILVERVKEGVKEELLELVKIPNIGRVKARILYNAGFRSLEKLKEAKEIDIIKLPGIGKETYNSIKEYLKNLS
jgi:helicase